MSSNSASNSRQCIKANMAFKTVLKEEGENMKKIIEALKAHISGTVRRIRLKFRIGGAPPRGNSHRKFHVFLLSYRCIKTVFSLFL